MVNTEKIVLGGGCFWCTEAVFSMFKGVVKTTPGYAGGKLKNPTYEDVCSGTTGHAEVLQVEYDPEVAPTSKILEVFFKMHDPTSVNGQGNDVGTQYRSIILYTPEEQKAEIDRFIGTLQKSVSGRITTEVRKLDAFYPAEEYHREYFKKNPANPYCMFVIRPKVAKIEKEFGLS